MPLVVLILTVSLCGNDIFYDKQDSAAEAEGIEKMAANAASVMNDHTPNAKKDD